MNQSNVEVPRRPLPHPEKAHVSYFEHTCDRDRPFAFCSKSHQAFFPSTHVKFAATLYLQPSEQQPVVMMSQSIKITTPRTIYSESLTYRSAIVSRRGNRGLKHHINITTKEGNYYMLIQRLLQGNTDHR